MLNCIFGKCSSATYVVNEVSIKTSSQPPITGTIIQTATENEAPTTETQNNNHSERIDIHKHETDSQIKQNGQTHVIAEEPNHMQMSKTPQKAPRAPERNTAQEIRPSTTVEEKKSESDIRRKETQSKSKPQAPPPPPQQEPDEGEKPKPKSQSASSPAEIEITPADEDGGSEEPQSKSKSQAPPPPLRKPDEDEKPKPKSQSGNEITPTNDDSESEIENQNVKIIIEEEKSSGDKVTKPKKKADEVTTPQKRRSGVVPLPINYDEDVQSQLPSYTKTPE